jgi:hypothetical protein
MERSIGKHLAEKINEAFVSVTRDIPPLSPIPSPDTQLQSDHTTIPTEYIIGKKTLIIDYLQYHLRKRLAQMKYRIGF